MSGWPIVAALALLLAIGGLLIVLALGRLWRLSRGDHRLGKAQCPHCGYPLRFNGTEHWCSECGYRHPVKA